MKILFVAPIAPPVTGQSLACTLFLDFLRNAGHEVVLVNLSKNSFENGSGSPTRVIEIGKILYLVATNIKGCSLVYMNPSESVAGNLKDLLIYALLGKHLPSTYIHMHGGAGMRRLLSQEHPWLRRANAWFLKRIAGAVVLGSRLASVYQGIVPNDKIHIVKNFALDEIFIDDRKLQEKFDDPSPLRVLYLSNLLPGKGYMELCKSIKLLAGQTRRRVAFDFAGGFESEKAKAEFLALIANEPGVTYHGPVHGAAKVALLQQAHVLALPTYYPFEGQPISILEAYAAGCSVITTDHSGIFDTFHPGRNGQQVEKESAQSIADALTHAVANPSLIRQYALTNLAEAHAHYRVAHHLAALANSVGIGPSPSGESLHGGEVAA